MAVDKEGPVMDCVPDIVGAGGEELPFFYTQGLGSSAQGAGPLPVDLSVAQAQLVPTSHRNFRLLLEESAFQALSEEPLLKRLHTKCGALPGGEGSLLSLPFPRKWTPLCFHLVGERWHLPRHQ